MEAINLPEKIRSENGTTRGKRENIKEKIVIEHAYRDMTLEREDIAEVEYRPTKCKKSYRLVICRKTISVKRGQQWLIPETRYFFIRRMIVIKQRARCF